MKFEILFTVTPEGFCPGGIDPDKDAKLLWEVFDVPRNQGDGPLVGPGNFRCPGAGPALSEPQYLWLGEEAPELPVTHPEVPEYEPQESQAPPLSADCRERRPAQTFTENGALPTLHFEDQPKQYNSLWADGELEGPPQFVCTGDDDIASLLSDYDLQVYTCTGGCGRRWINYEDVPHFSGRKLPWCHKLGCSFLGPVRPPGANFPSKPQAPGEVDGSPHTPDQLTPRESTQLTERRVVGEPNWQPPSCYTCTGWCGQKWTEWEDVPHFSKGSRRPWCHPDGCQGMRSTSAPSTPFPTPKITNGFVSVPGSSNSGLTPVPGASVIGSMPLPSQPSAFTTLSEVSDGVDMSGLGGSRWKRMEGGRTIYTCAGACGKTWDDWQGVPYWSRGSKSPWCDECGAHCKGWWNGRD